MRVTIFRTRIISKILLEIVMVINLIYNHPMARNKVINLDLEQWIYFRNQLYLKVTINLEKCKTHPFKIKERLKKSTLNQSNKTRIFNRQKLNKKPMISL